MKDMNNCRVLLADDEAAILEGYKLLFDWEKYQCEIAGTAMDGQEAVEKARELKPDIVINQGTAGTINHQVGDVFVCRHFVDRDMHKMSGLGMECHIDSSELLAARGFCRHWTESATCNTGDSFLTELTDIEGDVVDMEAYAQAFVCRAKEIPFISVKYVSDVIGQNSVKHWQDRLEDARAGLSHFFNVLKESI